MLNHAAITAIGSYVPTKRLTNLDLEAIVETSDEWILERTGMRERRIADAQQFSSHLAIQAVHNLVQRYNKQVEDVDMIIVATSTPDYPFPSVACIVQNALQIKHCGAIDLSAACAGFSYGVLIAHTLIASGANKKVLVIGSEVLSKVTDYTDRSTCILFGDGAGAVIVEKSSGFQGLLSSYMSSNGGGGEHLYRAGLSNHMNNVEMLGNGKMVQNGREVYKWAVRTIPEGVKALLENANMTIDELDWFVPHSANLRMLESIAEKLELDVEKLLHSVEYFGNTSSASIPLALDLAVQKHKLQYGDVVALYGFGGGLTHCGVILKWGINQSVL